ncbi:MAG: hypothetical protein HZB37_02355 [Planctomycetes bacterium]|nr:hypothetical protein [Planctomycetota bacterium]
MARQWRIELKEAYYHILSRGNKQASGYYELKEGHCACARHLFFPAFTDGFQGGGTINVN